ncbi:MAG: hypothetical protein ACLGSA_03505 [Acidobacteriota bacterium]
MKSLLIIPLISLALAVLPAIEAGAAPIGTRTSQPATFSVTLDAFAYQVSSMVTYARTLAGMSVSTSQANLFSVVQPAGPQNNQGYSVIFTIPDEVIELYY